MYLIFVVLDAVPGRGEYAGTAQPAGRPGGGDSPTQHSAGRTQERAPCQLIYLLCLAFRAQVYYKKQFCGAGATRSQLINVYFLHHLIKVFDTNNETILIPELEPKGVQKPGSEQNTQRPAPHH